MEFRGIYQDGVIRPTEAVNLPDGTEVEFQPVGANGAPAPTPIDELERASREGRSGRSIEQIVGEHSGKTGCSINELAGPWPDDEDDIEEFLRFIREMRL